MVDEVFYDEAYINDLIIETGSRIKSDQKHPPVKHIIAIMRWGVFPAIKLHQYLPTTPSISTVTISFYRGKKATKDAEINGFNSHQFELWNEFQDNEILVVDDIADRGFTLQTFEKYYKGPTFRSFTVFVKPCSCFIPTYCGENLKNEHTWIVFPWDKK